MSSASELAELHALIGDLRRCVLGLKTRFGDIPGMRRIEMDAERILADVQLLESDAGELDLQRWAAERAQEKIAIPDTEYDSEFWRDVDDEGVGGHGRY
ncbi:hypothetical protein [Mycolicibacter senuensis]|uniref:Uncharacterized protein n=1 Tax=Mycolicibacter senuensis TaxID=386913 RepID=A0A7I9XP60_9MYCO|nr:hypothetical protein [Mycolicibacter senuensis]MDQ2628283.1 hypothetical protein [Actinomycetota bacterium]ORW69760.1 hypothetical protein AWC24_05080 [Mycolicibacter senuensis]GFG71762.1 hypothetical protein MSEN_34820 [Mycolicibacter senuensis]